jgi:predicted regulator of Ras-like GTPase activity (Roadblock/LC7/MglB family)
MMPEDNSWMLAEVTFIKGVRHAVVLTSDGLPATWCERTDEDTAAQLAAACAGIGALGHGLAELHDIGGLHQAVYEFDQAMLFVRRAGNGSQLAVLCDRSIDPAIIAQQMQAQVNKIGERALSAPARQSSA